MHPLQPSPRKYVIASRPRPSENSILSIRRFCGDPFPGIGPSFPVKTRHQLPHGPKLPIPLWLWSFSLKIHRKIIRPPCEIRLVHAAVRCTTRAWIIHILTKVRLGSVTSRSWRYPRSLFVGGTTLYPMTTIGTSTFIWLLWILTYSVLPPSPIWPVRR